MFMLPRREKAFSQDMRFAAMMLPYDDVPASRGDVLYVSAHAAARGICSVALPGYRDTAAGAVPSPLGSPRLAVGIRDSMSRGMNCFFTFTPERAHAAEKSRIVSSYTMPGTGACEEFASKELPESAIKTEAFSGSFDYAPLSFKQ